MLTEYQFQKKETYAANKSIKYLIGHNDEDVVRHLCKKLSQMIGYVKCFKSNNNNDNNNIKKAMSFKVIDNKLLKRYIKIWKKSQQFNGYKI